MSTPSSSLPRVNTSLSPSVASSRNRAESGSSTPQTDLDEPQSLLPVGGFALAALAHIRPPVGTVKQ